MISRLAILVCCCCLSPVGWAEPRQESEAEIAYAHDVDQWTLSLAYYLTEVDSPIVNVLGSWHLDAMSRDDPALTGEGRKARALILNKAWSEPSVLVKLYGADYVNGQVEQQFDRPAIHTRLLALDPNNAAVVLLPWLYPEDTSADDLQLSSENVSRLVQAAQSDSFDLYPTAGVFDTYLETGKYQHLQNLPEIPQEVLNEFAARGWVLPADPLWAPSVYLLASTYTVVLTARFEALTSLCRLAQSEDHSEAIQACLDLADLMLTSSKAMLVAGIGYGIRRAIERPDYVGSNKELEDPDRWRDKVRYIESDCARPRIISSLNVGQLPADHWSLYLKDLQKSGEIVGNQQAAAREYALFPQEYPMDPSKCSLIHSLDEDMQKQLTTE